MRILLLVSVVLSVAAQQPAPPQALFDLDTLKPIATYAPRVVPQAVRFTKHAPPDLQICIHDICKTADEWTARK